MDVDVDVDVHVHVDVDVVVDGDGDGDVVDDRSLVTRVRPLALALAVALAACNGDGETCGPGDDPPSGVDFLSTNDGWIAYGNFTSSPNNDCTPAGATVTSLTVDGTQTDPIPPGAPQHMTFCVPRPDEIDGSPQPIGFTDEDDVRLVDIRAETDDCVYSLDRTTPLVDEAVLFEGFCDDGLHAAGYAMFLSIDVSLTRDCAGTVDTFTTIAGGRAVVSLP